MSENGKLKPSELRETIILEGGRPGVLRPRAARAADRLALAFADHFGKSLTATDTYRPLSEQYELARTKPHLAAPPGTSVHGLGEALDLSSNVNNFGSAENEWMRDNSWKYGWVWPGWAQKANRFEPWHYEYDDDRNRGGHWINFPGDGQIGMGSDSNYVKSLQKHLNSVRGQHPRIAEDGSFWTATYAAVRWYQRRHGLKPTGVVGVRTKIVLHRDGFGTGR